jgi:SAM-dependent methyltransferase
MPTQHDGSGVQRWSRGALALRNVDRHDWDARYAAADLVWSAEPNRFVEAETKHLSPGRALDLAAGEGRNAIWLAERGWVVTAVDYSRVALDKAASIAAAHNVAIETVEADVTTYEPDAGAFDLVLVAYLQTPVTDRVAWVRHAMNALKPGGTLLIVGHDRTNLEHGYGGPQDPEVLATPDGLASMLDGLEIEKAECVERVVDTPEGARVAIDHVVRARRSRS